MTFLRWRTKVNIDNITQDNHLVFTLADQPLKRVIRDIGGGTCPPHDRPPLIEEQTEFAPNNPAMVRQAFTADLVWAVAFAHGVDALNAIGVNPSSTVGAAKKARVQS